MICRESLIYLSGSAGIRNTTEVRLCCLLDRFGVAICLPGGCLFRSSAQHLFRVSFPPGLQAPLEAGIVESLRNHLEGDALMKYQVYFRWRTDACQAITHPVIQPLYFVARRRKIAEESIASGSKRQRSTSQRTISEYGIPVFLCNCLKCAILEPESKWTNVSTNPRLEARDDLWLYYRRTRVYL